MSAATLQETLPFDFEADNQVDSDALAHFPYPSPSGEPAGTAYTEEARQEDVQLCKRYFFRWAGAYGSGRHAAQLITFEEFQAAAKRLAPGDADCLLRDTRLGPDPKLSSRTRR